MSQHSAISSAVFGIGRALNPILTALHCLDAKFPPRSDGTTILGSSELADIVVRIEDLARECHTEEVDMSTALLRLQSLTSRLAIYENNVSQYAAHVAGIGGLLIDLSFAVRAARSALRKHVLVMPRVGERR